MPEPQGDLTILEHLEEFRRRLMAAALGTAATTVLGFLLHRKILIFLTGPAKQATGGESPLIFTSVTEMLGLSMKVAFLSGLVLAIPIWVYEIVMFVAPGLTPRERRYLLLFLPGVMAAFVTGVLFGYFVLIPPAIGFLLNFNTDIAVPFISIGNYVNLMITLLFWMGLVFETPVLMFLLAKLRIVSHRTFARWRRMAFVGAFLLGAAITPTFDPVNQTLVSLPIIVLYEAGIWLAWLARRGEKKAQPSG
ncbi:MAG: twin-arginine translocase subunit TatC [Chloroflexi bacterium]|nr:twin-arginine translocase subunit TatC [Chloroflexota bacterium]